MSYESFAEKSEEIISRRYWRLVSVEEGLVDCYEEESEDYDEYPEYSEEYQQKDKDELEKYCNDFLRLDEFKKIIFKNQIGDETEWTVSPEKSSMKIIKEMHDKLEEINCKESFSGLEYLEKRKDKIVFKAWFD